MNFASLMSAQIAKSKQPSQPTSAETKYLKRSEVEEARQQAYRDEQAALAADRQAKLEKKRKLEDEESAAKQEREAKRKRLAEESKVRQAEQEQKTERERRKRLGLPEFPKSTEVIASESEDATSLAEGEDDITEEELIQKLRDMKEPARIFGESHKQRISRYKRLAKPSSVSVMSQQTGPIPTSLEFVSQVDMKVPSKLPPATDKAARLFLSRQLVSWFTLVLQEWAVALAGRDEATKNTFSGRAAANSMTQALDHLKPMFRKLEKVPENPDELPDDLLAPIAEIVHAAQERRYVDANDGYLRLSIGKAAWPIGVTMVGIHERSAREKLHESDKGKAHIMADEVTRKILQSIKRCLSFAQTRWPPEDLGQLMG